MLTVFRDLAEFEREPTRTRAAREPTKARDGPRSQAQAGAPRTRAIQLRGARHRAEYRDYGCDQSRQSSNRCASAESCCRGRNRNRATNSHARKSRRGGPETLAASSRATAACSVKQTADNHFGFRVFRLCSVSDDAMTRKILRL